MEMHGQKILVVEDEPEIRDMLAFSLQRGGYAVTLAEDGESALRLLDQQRPDLILIDWMLPGLSGIELANRLRRDEPTQELPLIMLTARGEESDKLKSFSVGIDDYITKPFSSKELLARIKALLRRSGKSDDGRLTIDGLCLDIQGHRLLIDGKPVHIGPTEYRLLELFMSNPDRVYNRDQLLDRVWGRTVYVEERTVDVHILRLRKTLAPHGYDRLIQTVRGTGYRLSRT